MPCRSDYGDSGKEAREQLDEMTRLFCDAGRVLHEYRDQIKDKRLKGIFESWWKHREKDK